VTEELRVLGTYAAHPYRSGQVLQAD